jgi:hypothetical protein
VTVSDLIEIWYGTLAAEFGIDIGFLRIQIQAKNLSVDPDDTKM